MSDTVCPVCDGHKSIIYDTLKFDMLGAPEFVEVECDECSGTGKVSDG